MIKAAKSKRTAKDDNVIGKIEPATIEQVTTDNVSQPVSSDITYFSETTEKTSKQRQTSH